MRTLKQTSYSIAAILCICFPPAALAQVSPAVTAPNVDPNKVVVRVDGATIREGEIALALQAVLSAGQNPAQADPVALREQAIQYLIDRKLAVREAKRQGIDKRPEARRTAQYYIDESVRQLYLIEYARKTVTPEKIDEWYAGLKKELAGESEIRASHILVDDESQAIELSQRAKKGEDFAKLATDFSKGPTKSRGGDLGWFNPAQMVPEFSQAALRLRTGQISKPVKTQFGWHVIKMVDKRKAQVPPLDQIRNQGMQNLGNLAVQELMAGLRKKAKIERLDQR